MRWNANREYWTHHFTAVSGHLSSWHQMWICDPTEGSGWQSCCHRIPFIWLRGWQQVYIWLPRGMFLFLSLFFNNSKRFLSLTQFSFDNIICFNFSSWCPFVMSECRFYYPQLFHSYFIFLLCENWKIWDVLVSQFNTTFV